MIDESTLKSTPGPWLYQAGDSFDHGDDGEENGFDIFLCGGPRNHIRVIDHIRYAEDIFPEDAGYNEAKANAQLIAAAPELYEALRDIMNVIAVDRLVPESVSYMKQARAALAKARGEQS